MVLRFDMEISQKDYVKFCLYNLRQSIIRGAILLLLMEFTIMYGFNQKSVALSILTAAAVVLFVTGAALAFIYFRAKSNYKKSKLMKKITRFVIGDDGIHELSDFTDRLLEYKDVFMVRETYDAVYIYVKPHAGIILVKERFPDDETNGQLRRILSKNLPKNKLRLITPLHKQK